MLWVFKENLVTATSVDPPALLGLKWGRKKFFLFVLIEKIPELGEAMTVTFK